MVRREAMGESGERDRKSVDEEELCGGVQAWQWVRSMLQRSLTKQMMVGSCRHWVGSPGSRL